MNYEFIDAGERRCSEIANEYRDLLLTRTVVCTSFDSGIGGPRGWSRHGQYATNQINETLLADWPISHDEYCDEWWIFEDPPPTDFEVHAFCNFIGMRITNYRELDFSEGCQLDEYLMRFRPLLVFGNNADTYVIRRRAN